MEKIPARDGYGKAIVNLALNHDRVIILDADVAKSTRTDWVKKAHPEKFIDMGISEQDMVGTAAGLSMTGMIPFATTYCVFLTGRAFDQIRTTVCYGDLNVKFAGAHAGISVGPDGATHQALEDVALMRVLPNMTVIVPCDVNETEKATMAMAKVEGPCFIRFGREAVPVITDEHTPFEIGKARLVKEGKDVVVFANGPMVYESMVAAEELKKEGISVMVVDLHTVKPLDTKFILESVKKTGGVVTAEEHQIIGGMGSAVAEFLGENCPVPMARIGVRDTFGESGKPEELMKKYGLTDVDIKAAILKVMGMKEKKG